MTNQEEIILDELLKIERQEAKRREILIQLDAIKAEKLHLKNLVGGQQDDERLENAPDNLNIMDEDARWELALRQKQEADRQADKMAEKELLKNGIAKMRKLIEKQKKRDNKDSKKKKQDRKKERKKEAHRHGLNDKRGKDKVKKSSTRHRWSPANSNQASAAENDD